MADISDLFALYGRAAYYAQIIEYDLVSIWMLDSMTQGVCVTRADLARFQGKWSKRTLGRLLQPFEHSPLLRDSLKEFLEVLRKTRNRLVHDFFLTADADLRTRESRDKVVAVLNEMLDVLFKGHELFRDVLTTYANDFGVDYAEILKNILRETALDV
jgi:hypothetical protein